MDYQNRRVYYQEYGSGFPLLLIHGNSVSSKLFASLKKSFKQDFRVILFDFPGHGKSSRLEKFNTDFWFYNSEVAFQLIKFLQLEKVFVLGTSGGALVGINLALEHPEVVEFLIADSFEGAYPDKNWIGGLREERRTDKKKYLAKLFWLFNHGLDWSKVVDQDTDVNIEFFETNKPFFHKDISELSVPTLFTGSLQDEYIDNIEKRYSTLTKRNPAIKTKFFETGSHPAILAHKGEFKNLLLEYMKDTT